MRESQSFQQELVPLNEATAVAHHLLIDRTPGRSRPEELIDRQAELVLALGALANILVRENDRLRLLPMGELHQLVSPPRPNLRRELEGCYIRRCNLINAIEALKGSLHALE